jgi:hypothetical protein
MFMLRNRMFVPPMRLRLRLRLHLRLPLPRHPAMAMQRANTHAQ